MIKEVEVFESAVADYRDQKFDRAKEVMATLYRNNPLRLYAIYLHRINNYLKSPPAKEAAAERPADVEQLLILGKLRKISRK